MWVKICGNTNLEDAMLAAELGADAVGFVFAESKRQVTAAQVAAITSHLPEGVERVGVFYSRDAEEIAQIVAVAGLTTVQLHGGLDEGLLDRLGEEFAGQLQIIQTLHWVVDDGSPYQGTYTAGAAAERSSVLEERSSRLLVGQLARIAALGTADRVLIDSKIGAVGGGTGIAFDWAIARQLFASPPSGVRLIVAGGLKPNNVADAVAQLIPWGVDVCSGVEAFAGRKDPAKLAHFMQNSRAPRTP